VLRTLKTPMATEISSLIFPERAIEPGISLPDEQRNYSFGDRFSFGVHC